MVTQQFGQAVLDTSTISERLQQQTATCSYCSGTGWELIQGKGVRPCLCTKSERLRKLFEASHIPARFSESSLRTFCVPAENPALLLAYSYVHRIIRDYPEVDRGLLLMGNSGVGKTHLGVATLLGLLERGVRCRFYDYAALLKEIQASYNSGSDVTEIKLLEPIFNIDVILLDELGAMKPTEWVLDTVRLIINQRYNAGKLTLATTNYFDEPRSSGEDTLEQRIGSRIRSRLYQMCKTIVIEGSDWRRRFDSP